MALLTVTTEGNSKIPWGMIGTYGIIFLINLLYDIIGAGGIIALGWIFIGDALIKAFFITLVIFASNKGIAWKQGQTS